MPRSAALRVEDYALIYRAVRSLHPAYWPAHSTLSAVRAQPSPPLQPSRRETLLASSVRRGHCWNQGRQVSDGVRSRLLGEHDRRYSIHDMRTAEGREVCTHITCGEVYHRVESCWIYAWGIWVVVVHKQIYVPRYVTGGCNRGEIFMT